MDQKRIQILVILLFYQKIASGSNTRKQVTQEKVNVDIQCVPSVTGSMIIWFRVLDSTNMEFIGSFSTTGIVKQSPYYDQSIFSFSKMRENTLGIKSFNKIRDSGMYSCASLHNNALNFGKVTRLVGQETVKITTKAPPTITPKMKSSTTPCACNTKTKEEKEGRNPSMMCKPILLGALAGSCVLLVLLLIITICYCNRIRTRRCPHHYKRRPRVAAPGKQAMANRPV